MQNKSHTLRELIAAPEILVMPGIYDGYSARVVARAGFKAGFITGAGVSEASLGWADVGVMSYEENLRVCRAMVGCFDLPTIADADTGYGNAVNVHFTVRGFEQAGVSVCLLKTPKGRESLEIFAPLPYGRGHDRDSFPPSFPSSHSGFVAAPPWNSSS